MKQKFNLRNWLYRLLTHQIVPQERELHWKLSHYATKIIVIVLIFRVVNPLLSSNIAEAGEKIESGKVLGVSDTKMIQLIAEPIDGTFDMSSLDSIMKSMDSASKTTQIYIDKISKSIENLDDDIKKINNEIENTRKEIDNMKKSILEILLEMDDIEDSTLLVQLLDGNKFSEIQQIIAQNEIIFSNFSQVLKLLILKESELNDLKIIVETENIVRDNRINEKKQQNIQIEAIKEGAEFFENMNESQYKNFFEKEKEARFTFLRNMEEEESINIDIYNRAIEKDNIHFQSLSDKQAKLADELDREALYLKNEIDDAKEDDIDKLLDYLSYNTIDTTKNLADIIDEIKILPVANAISKAKLNKIKAILKASKKLNKSEKRMINRLKTEKDIKRLIIRVITRIKKEKERASKISRSVSKTAKKMNFNKRRKNSSKKESFFTHPLKVNPLYVTATYGDPEYERLLGIFHTGIDMGAPQKTPIYAAEDGVVKSVVIDNTPALAYMIVVHGDKSKMSAYLHVSSIIVKPGDIVKRGQVIGYTGGTPGTAGAGFSSGPHLHFEVREMTNTRVNPYPKYIPSDPPKIKYM